MSHRADQIIDQIATLLRAALTDGTHVFTHRRLSLAADQDELPAVSVDFGEDSAVDQNTGFIDSILTVEITGVAADYDEQDLRQELLRLRREVHVALMATADTKLGIPAVVVMTTYGGAAAPEVDVSGEQLVGSLTATWLVYYRMNRTDPGD